MTQNQTIFALCGALALVGCAHHGRPRQRTSVAAITNKEVTGKREDGGKTRMSYTRVSDQTSLNRDGSAKSAERTADVCDREVFFDANSALIDHEAERRLTFMADCMKRGEIDHALVVGRGDSPTNEEENRELFLARARLTAEYLKDLGVPPKDIHVRAKDQMASADSPLPLPGDRGAVLGEEDGVPGAVPNVGEERQP
jgi:outer membrane protein OmpA-like peptidoglycan-associated protein